MAKLKTLLAQALPEWPEGADYALQNDRRESDEYEFVYFYGGVGSAHDFLLDELADDSEVTRAQWQAERARLLLDSQPERDQKIKELVELACGKKLPYAFTEADIRAAFEAGANWMRGAVEAGAAEYVDKLKGLK